MRIPALVTLLALTAYPTASAEITRIWLTHKTSDPSRIVVNWETAKPGDSVVRYGLSQDYTETVAVEETAALHHVEIPLAKRDTTYHYRVSTGDQTSGDATFQSFPTDVLRVAVVADWQFYDSQDVLFKDDQWHCVEAYFKLNTLDLQNDRPNRDGIVRGWFDGTLVVEHTDVVLRSTDFPKMKFNQFLMAPYFGPGLLPHAQKLWIDELAVGIKRIGPLESPK